MDRAESRKIIKNSSNVIMGIFSSAACAAAVDDDAPRTTASEAAIPFCKMDRRLVDCLTSFWVLSISPIIMLDVDRLVGVFNNGIGGEKAVATLVNSSPKASTFRKLEIIMFNQYGLKSCRVMG